MNTPLAHDHEELDEILRGFYVALDAGDVEESFNRLDLFWARLGIHIRAENLRLFPAILDALTANKESQSKGALTLDEARRCIAQLKGDHDFFMRELASAIKELRELRAARDDQSVENRLQDVRRRVAAIKSRLETHNELEEKHVYRWTDVLLSLPEQSRLAAQVKSEIENLLPRFMVADDDQLRSEKR